MADETVAFEAEAEATRDRIAATMDDLQNRLSPRTIVNNAVGSFGARSSDAIASLRGALGAHPIALAAVGLVVGVTLLARSRIRGAEIEYGDSYAAYTDYDDGYAANLADDYSSDRRQGAGLASLQTRAHDAVDDNPLGVVLVGVATGALLGAIVPLTQTENQLFGDARDRLASAARAATDAAMNEMTLANFSLAGGTTGLAERASQALLNVAEAARADLIQGPERVPARGISG